MRGEEKRGETREIWEKSRERGEERLERWGEKDRARREEKEERG